MLDQLGQLAQVIKLKVVDAFRRCVECNRALVPRKQEEVKDRVPPYVYRTHSQYMQCPDCQRVYWQGSHWEAMRRRIEGIAAGDGQGRKAEEGS